MNWKKFLSYKHHHLNAHHLYQINVILWFILYFVLFITYFVYTDKFDVDINTYQWYLFVPFMTFYIVYNLWLRNRIPTREEIAPLRRPLIHWILLGISSIFLYTNSVDLEVRPASIILAFIIFTLFAADGYWDFKEKVRLFHKK